MSVILAYSYRRVGLAAIVAFAGIASCGSARPAHAEGPSTRRLILTYTLTEGVDLGSQEWALRRGAFEVNPLMRGSLDRRASIKLTSMLVLAGGSKILARSHPKVERWARRALIVRTLVAVVLNVRAGREAQRRPGGGGGVPVPSR